MKKLRHGLILVSVLSFPIGAHAADRTTLGVGTGAVAGALVGGPIGAVFGAVAGGVIGANSAGIRSGGGRRARLAQRRRSAVRPVRRQQPLAARGAAAPDPVRPVAVTSPARPSAPGAGASGWKDPH